jgi:hypothetical protein
MEQADAYQGAAIAAAPYSIRLKKHGPHMPVVL